MARTSNFLRAAGLLLPCILEACSSSSQTDERLAAHITFPAVDGSTFGTAATIDNGFSFDEGPIWSPSEQALFFSDINGDAIWRMTLPHAFDVYLQPAGKPDGLALDPQGRIIGAGFASRDVFRVDGRTRTVLVSEFEGKKLNSPDDLIARSDGTIYFTDPLFGINGSQGLPAQTQELDFQGVFRITKDGATHLEDQSADGPNGVELSPDEHTLYVSYTLTGEIYSFAVAPDGSLSKKTLFAKATLADSMCVDAAGNLYVAAYDGIEVFDPKGDKHGVIAVPEIPTNAAFGGPDQTTLFITARKALTGTPTVGNSSLYRVDEMPIPGLPGRP